jgi:hypothetical protein
MIIYMLAAINFKSIQSNSFQTLVRAASVLLPQGQAITVCHGMGSIIVFYKYGCKHYNIRRTSEKLYWHFFILLH